MFGVRGLVLGLTGHPLLKGLVGDSARKLLVDPLAATASGMNAIPQRSKYRARKPRGMPRSRKKRYWVMPVAEVDPFEYSQLFWRYQHYRTARKSLAPYFAAWKAEYYPAESITPSPSQGQPSALDSVAPALSTSSPLPPDFIKAIEDNEAENAKVARVREARHAEEMRFREDERLDVLTQWETRRQMEQDIREEQIRRKKEIVKNMVTPANLVERIHYALDHPTDYNFAIDMGGQKRFGRPDPLRRLNLFLPPPPRGGDRERQPQHPRDDTFRDDGLEPFERQLHSRER